MMHDPPPARDAPVKRPGPINPQGPLTRCASGEFHARPSLPGGLSLMRSPGQPGPVDPAVPAAHDHSDRPV